MSNNIKTSIETPLIGVLAPLSQAAAARSTGWIAAKDYFSFMAMIAVGVIGASATVDAKVQQATDSAGTAAKDIPGIAITQIVASGKNAAINFCQDDIDMTNGFAYVRLTVTVGVAATLTAAMLFGDNARYEVATNTVADQTI